MACRVRLLSRSAVSSSPRLRLAKFSSISLVQQVYPWGQMRRCSPVGRGQREGDQGLGARMGFSWAQPWRLAPPARTPELGSGEGGGCLS